MLVIRGNNITIDFNGATLLGSSWSTDPDQRKGVGLRVEGKNVTIKHLNVHGYKVGLMAKNSPNLRIIACDFSYNWKQRLMSTLDREDGSDWMSFHHNEKDQWLEYGAGIYLRGCDGFEVKATTIRGGQCGLMITDCNKGKIWNNDFSFLSAIGLGMYRSSDNKIMHNNIDWCVRGYSHGKWNRGQDSAGILIYEQSSRNVFAYNSVTHGGDGFFLWAGQTTMDNGSGGCNDNLLFGNDWSHAPTNGIEATFSRNKFVNNLILECWHGIWGGYSWDSLVLGNVFGMNGQAIAWEHGQDVLVANNVFHRDTEGISIWMNKTQDPNWGYPKNRDTKSRNWQIGQNWFDNIPGNGVSVRDSTDISIGSHNSFLSIGRAITLAGENPSFSYFANDFRIPSDTLPAEGKGIGESANKVSVDSKFAPLPSLMRPDGNVILGLDPKTGDYLKRFEVAWNPWLRDAKNLKDNERASKVLAPESMAGGKNPFLKKGSLRGRRYILVDQWGPYDFLSPLIWPRGDLVGNTQVFEVLGPKGVAKITKLQGATFLSACSDGSFTESGARGGGFGQIDVPSFIKVRLEPGRAQDVLLEFEYSGSRVRTPFGEKIPAGVASKFRYTKFFMPIEWQVSYYAYDGKTQDPRSSLGMFREITKDKPLRTQNVSELNFSWGGSPAEGVPADHFATVSEADVDVPEGTYTLNVTSDDGMRFYLDGKVVLENWTYHGPTLDKTTLSLSGKHKLRVEHFELDGYSALKVELVPKR